MIRNMSLFNLDQFLRDSFGQITKIVISSNNDPNTVFIDFHKAFSEMIDKNTSRMLITRCEQFSKRKPRITKGIIKFMKITTRLLKQLIKPKRPQHYDNTKPIVTLSIDL